VNYSLIPDAILLAQWDTGWNNSIKVHGYSYNHDRQSNTAFFPLFPYLWRFSQLGVLGISIFNTLIFGVGLILISYYFKATIRTQFLFLAIPCITFFIVPYSESLFFLFTSLVLIGMQRQNTAMIVLGFILAVLTRSAGAIFLPALIGTAFFMTERGKTLKTTRDYSLYILACVVATFSVILFQYFKTGVWFAAAKTQIYWNHSFRLPDFPLYTWRRGTYQFLLRIDGIASFIGIVAFVALFFLFLQKIKNNFSTEKTKNYFIFSLLYLGGAALSIFLFQGGDLHSINRYIFATPFFFIGLLELGKYELSTKHILAVLGGLCLYWLCFEIPTEPIDFICQYVLVTLVVGLFLCIFHPNKTLSKYAFVIVYLVLTFTQAWLFNEFLHSKWLG
jgi:hypothetical protein